MQIHGTAVVSPEARLAEGVKIEAYTIIGPNVTIGAGTIVGPHAVVDGWTTIGAHNHIYPFASVGLAPQDMSYRGEQSYVVIGDRNIVRESVTIHRGTERGGGVTRIGNNNLIMAYCHVAHDCLIGNHVIMSNAATLAGHVRIDDHAILGGLVGVHQFVRIGTHAFVGAMSGMGMDLPPYMLGRGIPAKLYGPNLVGLRRYNFSAEAMLALKKSYRILFRSKLTLKDAIERVHQEVQQLPEVEILVQFLVDRSERGIARGGSTA